MMSGRQDVQHGLSQTEGFIQPERLHSRFRPGSETQIMSGRQDVQHGLSETRGMSASELEPLMATDWRPISHLRKPPTGPSMGTLVQKDPEAQLLVDQMRQEVEPTEMLNLQELRRIGMMMEKGATREEAESLLRMEKLYKEIHPQQTNLTWSGR